MTPTTVLRIGAALAAVGAVIEPSFLAHRRGSLPVDVRAVTAGRTSVPDPGASGARHGAADIVRRLSDALGDEAAINGAGPAAAIVLVGGSVDAESRLDVPVSVVHAPPPPSGRATIVAVRAPGAALPGWEARIAVDVDAAGMRGRASAIVLEHGGIALTRVEHRWTRDSERATIAVPFTPPAEGTWPLRARVADVAPYPGSAADVLVAARARVLKVAAIDPRPGWSTTFVRRALEGDPAFDVAAIVRASRGVDVESGTPPAALTADALGEYDAVVVGAPGELTRREVDALDGFARRRGGAVLLLADRKPEGPVAGLIPAAGFDEVLLEKPVEIDTAGRRRIRASELVLPRDASGAEPLAAVRLRGANRAIIVSWPVGEGQVVFSGALDAWRYRDGSDDAFAAFWRSVVASAASMSPRRVQVGVVPGVAAPGSSVTIRAAVRPSASDREGGALRVQPVRTELIDTATGAVQFVRLWPSAAPGAFEARLSAPASGRYDVRVSTEDGSAADAPFVVAADAAAPIERADPAQRLLADITGGVVVEAGALGPLVAHLRGLPRPSVEARVRPSQSVWWTVAFVFLACAEWTLRRRRGSR